MITKVKETISKYKMLSQEDHVLVALSGGPDSVCLLRILSLLKDELEIGITALYIDHGLRPCETPFEMDFCKKFCDSLGIPLIIKSIDVVSFAQSKKISKQEAARELRYKVFYETAYEGGADKIALGHNADDQAETVLIRLIRGAGPLGLSGIPPVRQKIIRPLIEIERTEIEAFLDSNGTSFVMDSSNLTDRYTRNRIRHLIMPEIKKINPEAVKSILRTAEIYRSEEKYFDIIVAKSMMKMISRKNEQSIELFIAPMEILDPVILRRILRRAINETKGLRGITFVHIEDIIQLIRTGKSGDRLYLPGKIRVIKKYSVLVISSEDPKILSHYTIESPGEIYLRESSITFYTKLLDIGEIDSFGDGKTTAYINADKLDFPLLVRPRQNGDYFYPLGFGKKKKLQDYFVDEKIPRDERDAIPLLVNNGDVVWVAGHRIDERYRVDKTTRKVLQCNIKY